MCISLGLSVGPLSIGVDVGAIVNLILHKKVNKDGVLTLEFTYENRTTPMRVSQSKFSVRRKLNKWYKLLPDEDFEVRVRNASTGKYSAELAKAVKLFLTDMRGSNAVRGMVNKYLRLPNALTDFIYANKLDKATDDKRLKYSELYYELLTIAKILTPPRAYLSKDECCLKVYLPRNDFHFSVDLPKKDLEDFDAPFGKGLIEMGNAMICEQIIPVFYHELGYRSDEFLDAHPEIMRLEDYYISED